MGVKATAIMSDYDVVGGKTKFDFLQFSSSPFTLKGMNWDSEHATTIGMLTHLFKNVQDTKTLTIKKAVDSKVDPIIKKAHRLRKSDEEEGDIDVFQLMFVGSDEAKSLLIKNPKVIYVKDLRENKKNFFVFTLKAEEVKESGAAEIH